MRKEGSRLTANGAVQAEPRRSVAGVQEVRAVCHVPTLDRLQRDFDQQGYVILTSFLEPETLRGARLELTKLVDEHARKLMAEGKITDARRDEPFETRLARLYE